MTSESSTRSSILDERSLQLRRLMLRALAAADKGHVGSALSLLEIFRVLYDSVVRHDPQNPAWPERDRVILSKGHGCLALYTILADQGYFPAELLESFCERHSPLGGHPERDIKLGVEASTGSLGHGLPLGVGMAVAHQRLGDAVRIFVIVGDGEINEGSNWEALMTAAKHQLSRLTIIVDHNGQQQNGPIANVLPLGDLRAKLEAFGALVEEVDGHRPDRLLESFRRVSSRISGPPGAVICHTVKGKGLAVAEHNAQWHYRRSFGEQGIQEIAAQWAGARS